MVDSKRGERVTLFGRSELDALRAAHAEALAAKDREIAYYQGQMALLQEALIERVRPRPVAPVRRVEAQPEEKREPLELYEPTGYPAL